MKNLMLSLLLLFSGALFASQPFGGTEPQIIIVVNTADWCPTCQKHGERVEKEFLSELQKNQNYQVLINDLSNDQSKSKSQMELEAAGLSQFSAENNGTGRIYFLDPKSKKVIDRVSIRKDNDKLLEELQEALAEIS